MGKGTWERPIEQRRNKMRQERGKGLDTKPEEKKIRTRKEETTKYVVSNLKM